MIIRAEYFLPKTRWRSALLAAAIAAMPLPVLADTITLKDLSYSVMNFTVSIPTVEIVDGNFDEATARTIFSFGPGVPYDKLAHLSARSLSIPTIDVKFTAPSGSPANPIGGMNFTYSGLKLDNITDGVANGVTFGATDLDASGMFQLHYGAVTIGQLDLGRVMGFYGLVPLPPSTELSPLYSDYKQDGGTISGPNFKCTIGPMSLGNLSARPLKTSFAEIGKLTQQMQADALTGKSPPPEAIRQIVDFEVDILTAFSTTPARLDGVDCSGQGENDQTVKVTTGALNIGGFEPAHYPEFSLDNLNVDAGSQGTVTLGNATWKKMDFTTVFDALQHATTLDEAWFAANARKLIPAMDGLSLSNLAVDIDSRETAGERVKGTLAGLDITLGKYLNGIPTDISLTTDHAVFPVPETSESPVPELRAAGIDTLDVSGATQMHWDEATSTIVVDKLMLGATELGDITISGVLGNATAALFGDDPMAMEQAAMGLTVKSLKLDIADRGFGPIIIAASAKEAGQPVAAFRTGITGMAQGVTLAMLGNSDAALKAAQAIGNFLGGQPNLSMTITAKDPAGLTLQDFAAAENDPTALAGKFDVVATASGDPLPEAPTPPDAPATDAPDTPMTAPTDAPPSGAPAERPLAGPAEPSSDDSTLTPMERQKLVLKAAPTN